MILTRIIKKHAVLCALFVFLVASQAFAESVTLKVLAINPSKDKEQEVPIKTFLPAEVKPENVMNRQELEIVFDTSKSLYYVEKKVVLKPGETYTMEVNIDDIWLIDDAKLENTEKRAENSIKILEGTGSYDVAKLVYDNLVSTTKIIRSRQSAAGQLPQEHIAAYRLNLKLMDEALKDLGSLEEFAAKNPASRSTPSLRGPLGDGGIMGGTLRGGQGGDGTGTGGRRTVDDSINFTWKLMLAIIGFLAVLSLLSFMVWQRQLKDLVRPKQIDMLSPEERLHERSRLLNLASRDDKTGLLNLNHFKELLDDQMEEARAKPDKIISLIMADIDFFKRVNDTYGHVAGDEVLKAVAEILQQNSDKTMGACRYGGEEFIMMLPGLDGENAEKVAEKIRKNIEDRHFFLGPKKIRHPITTSFGVATYNHKETPEDLIKRVDTALYKAKVTGRNRVYRA